MQGLPRVGELQWQVGPAEVGAARRSVLFQLALLTWYF